MVDRNDTYDRETFTPTVVGNTPARKINTPVTDNTPDRPNFDRFANVKSANKGNARTVNPLEAFVRTLKEKLARHNPITLDDLKELEHKAGDVALKGSGRIEGVDVEYTDYATREPSYPESTPPSRPSTPYKDPRTK